LGPNPSRPPPTSRRLPPRHHLSGPPASHVTRGEGGGGALPLLLWRIRAGAAPWSPLGGLPTVLAYDGGGGRAPRIRVSPDRIWGARVWGAPYVCGWSAADIADGDGGRGCGRCGAATMAAGAEENRVMRPVRYCCRRRLRLGLLCLPESGLAAGVWRGQGREGHG
jgi:hypothetical protein